MSEVFSSPKQAVRSVLLGDLTANTIAMGADKYKENKEKKEQKLQNANAAEAEALKKAEATVLAEKEAADEKTRKRAALSAQTTSGFGANNNLARSFLTSL